MIKYFLILFVFILQAQNNNLKHFDYSKADMVAESLYGEDLKNLPVLAHKLTAELKTKQEKFRAIYKWVCTNIESDFSTFQKNERKRSRFKRDTTKLNDWNRKITKTALKNLVEDKTSVCTGYAYLIKKLSSLADIECEIVNGFGRTYDSHIQKLDLPNHSWNAVKLNDKWYFCDATWSSGYFDTSTYSFIQKFYSGYFLSDSEIFIRDHYPLEDKWKLGTEFTALDFVNSPLIYENTHEKQIKLQHPKQMFFTSKKNKPVAFEFTSTYNLEKENIKLLIGSSNKMELLIPTDITEHNGEFKFNHYFKYNGTYDVHLIINGDTIASYVINVKKR